MKKVRLEIADLSVDSFATHSEPGVRGTVAGHFTAVRDGCKYPTPSCQPGQTVGEFTCYCLYAQTDEHLCCQSDIWCTNTCQGGGGTANTCANTCGSSCYGTCPPSPC